MWDRSQGVKLASSFGQTSRIVTVSMVPISSGMSQGPGGGRCLRIPAVALLRGFTTIVNAERSLPLRWDV